MNNYTYCSCTLNYVPCQNNQIVILWGNYAPDELNNALNSACTSLQCSRNVYKSLTCACPIHKCNRYTHRQTDRQMLQRSMTLPKSKYHLNLSINLKSEIFETYLAIPPSPCPVVLSHPGQSPCLIPSVFVNI